MELRWITTGDALYAEERGLRVRLLREPMGLEPGTELFPFEDESLHLVAMEAGAVIGCVLFHPKGRSGRLYQMAVDFEYQRRGIGRRLVAKLEAHLREEGFQEITLHARDIAVPFYERLGFEIIGEPFTEVGIPHRTMRKAINQGKDA